MSSSQLRKPPNAISLPVPNTISSAYCRFVTSCPPTLKPPSKLSRANLIMTSATMLKRYGETCLTPFRTLNHSLFPPAMRTFDFWLSHNDLIREIRLGGGQNPYPTSLSTTFVWNPSQSRWNIGKAVAYAVTSSNLCLLSACIPHYLVTFLLFSLMSKVSNWIHTFLLACFLTISVFLAVLRIARFKVPHSRLILPIPVQLLSLSPSTVIRFSGSLDSGVESASKLFWSSSRYCSTSKKSLDRVFDFEVYAMSTLQRDQHMATA